MDEEARVPESTPPAAPPRKIPWGRLAAAGLVIAALVIFAVQNTDDVNVQFLAWDIDVPLVFVIAIAIGLALVADDLIGYWWRRRKERKSE